MLKKGCFLNVCLLVVGSIPLLPLWASVPLTCDPHKRLSVPISSDTMNRIAFSNDRITHVFGDDDAYTLQTDDIHGHIFLKPSEANGDKPIAITLTTEQNRVHDLELLPQKRAACTVILKGAGSHEPHGSGDKRGANVGVVPGGYLGAHPSPYQSIHGHHAFHAPQSFNQDDTTWLVNILKGVARHEIIPSSSPDERPPELKLPELKLPDVTVEGVRVIHTQGLSVAVYRLTNTNDHRYELVENAFAGSMVESMDGKGIRAIAMEKKFLAPGESIRLFVVRHPLA